MHFHALSAQTAAPRYAGRVVTTAFEPASLSVSLITKTFITTEAPGCVSPKLVMNSGAASGACSAMVDASSSSHFVPTWPRNCTFLMPSCVIAECTTFAESGASNTDDAVTASGVEPGSGESRGYVATSAGCCAHRVGTACRYTFIVSYATA